MYIDKALQSDVSYKFGQDKQGRWLVNVSYKGLQIALLSTPKHDSDIEACQKHLYAVVRSYKKMMNIGDGM